MANCRFMKIMINLLLEFSIGKILFLSVLFFVFLFSANALAQTGEFDEQPGYQAW